MLKGLLVILLISSANLYANPQLNLNVEIPPEVSIKNPRALGLHDCSLKQSDFVKVAAFEVDSNSLSGFTLSAEWAHGFGWALNGTGSTQGVDFNSFKQAKIDSDNTSNYQDSKPLNRLLPKSWNKKSSSQTRSIKLRGQKGLIMDWTINVYLKWNAAPSLQSGIYSQVLSVTIDPN